MLLFGLRVLMSMTIFQASANTKVYLPLFLSNVAAGFPSPAEDYIDRALDLNEYLIKHPAATFYVRVRGDSMIKAGIFDGDLVMIDRSIDPGKKSVVLAVVNGEFTLKRFLRDENILVAENDSYNNIYITKETDFQVWGVATNVIHSLG